MIYDLRGQRIVWLVRSLTALGLLSGVIATGLFGWALTNVRRERALVSAEKTQLDATVDVLNERTAGYENHIVALLDETAVIPKQENMDAGLTEYVHSQSRLQSNAAVQLPLDQLNLLMVRAAELSVRAYRWRRDHDRVWADVSRQRTLG